MKTSYAHIQVRLDGWTRDEAIAEIAHFDRVTLEQAAIDYDRALRQLHARQRAAMTRREMTAMAKRDAKKYLSTGEFISAFNSVSAKRYRSYSNEFWKLVQNHESTVVYDDSGFSSGAGVVNQLQPTA